TKPYRDEQWSAIVALGRAVDADLEHLDVRLTMGGEPTFVAVDDPEGAEWNTAALGPTKRQRAVDVFAALKAKYAPHGLVHFGQGKWYPGEQLPRWSLNCHWRNDGEACWRDNALIADEQRDNGADAEQAGRFLRALAARLGVDAERAFAVYEDAGYYLWREQRLPANVDAADSRLRDPLERERLQRVFAQALGDAVGHVLPLARKDDNWRSSAWPLRGGACLLVPGDSPIGYRLPLDSLPWAAPAEQAVLHERDPSQSLPPLPLFEPPVHRAVAAPVQKLPLKKGASAPAIIRTALCAQARAGTLYLFMPPLERAEDYLELVAAIEATASALATPVLLEGYEPPRDARLSVFRVTPDPGVIEVNIHPAARWDELVERTTHLYETAHAARLSAEKFMVDGRHVGTGGGNHFVLGGATPNDSPFLRRPDLLRSLLSYWLAHPSLSYLFSGLFIGPTSQAPRVDEARNDSLYELELAFQQFPRSGEEAAPWLVDRLLRNLLIDVTGNTHRTEFCIDKLFSPDGPTGRLGLVELRAFEMPPHARMSLVQQLLLRALVARFWREPYAPVRLPRWGSELHDRFLLPHFVAQDFADVIAETCAVGYALDPAWFAPHLEFRFPKLGDLAIAGIELELRHALEPWHVMGEEGSAGGAVRYVDSSLERLQVKLGGLSPDRYALACNGRRVPLRSTGTAGEYVAGVRYRAWQPASALHPMIGVHAPLTFDLVDLWSGRAIAGCEYHVAHPGGRNYATFPVNAFEAESRRLARFFRSGHTPGSLDPMPSQDNPEFPFTLDLRRQ
ncbi:MAG: transglutaminase family protein, partial [Dokdonella sp.]